jgi:aryl-alcohol dehydrogenase-like predicted oxidoreductase
LEYRHLGKSGLKVPVLSFGTGTFGGKGEFFSAWGSTDVAEARKLIDICIDAGVSMFDSADIYSDGAAESVLGEAIKGRPRDKLILSTKATFRNGPGANEAGSSRHHLVRAVDSALKRLGTDYIDCSSCMASTRARPSRKPCPRSTISCVRASCAMWARRISRAGI